MSGCMHVLLRGELETICFNRTHLRGFIVWEAHVTEQPSYVCTYQPEVINQSIKTNKSVSKAKIIETPYSAQSKSD